MASHGGRSPKVQKQDPSHLRVEAMLSASRNGRPGACGGEAGKGVGVVGGRGARAISNPYEMTASRPPLTLARMMQRHHLDYIAQVSLPLCIPQSATILPEKCYTGRVSCFIGLRRAIPLLAHHPHSIYRPACRPYHLDRPFRQALCALPELPDFSCGHHSLQVHAETLPRDKLGVEHSKRLKMQMLVCM